MSAPVRPEPDPFSLALGRLEGRLDGVEKRLETLERYMVWGFGITWTLVGGIYAMLFQLAGRLPH